MGDETKNLDSSFNNEGSNSLTIEAEDINTSMFANKIGNSNSSKQMSQTQKKFTPIKSYKPSGNLIYNEDLINNLGNKLS